MIKKNKFVFHNDVEWGNRPINGVSDEKLLNTRWDFVQRAKEQWENDPGMADKIRKTQLEKGIARDPKIYLKLYNECWGKNRNDPDLHKTLAKKYNVPVVSINNIKNNNIGKTTNVVDPKIHQKNYDKWYKKYGRMREWRSITLIDPKGKKYEFVGHKAVAEFLSKKLNKNVNAERSKSIVSAIKRQKLGPTSKWFGWKVSNGKQPNKQTDSEWYEKTQKANDNRIKKLKQTDYYEKFGKKLKQNKKWKSSMEKVWAKNKGTSNKALCKKLKTPAGIFSSLTEASKFYGITKGSLADRKKRYPNKYYYID